MSIPSFDFIAIGGGIAGLSVAAELSRGACVNASGAWGDSAAVPAGAAPVGLRPKRRAIADRTRVVGFDAVAPGIFWRVGRGGHGIQTAPAMAGAALARGEPLPEALCLEGVRADALAPAAARFRESR